MKMLNIIAPQVRQREWGRGEVLKSGAKGQGSAGRFPVLDCKFLALSFEW
jgi:hypothetical protein